MVTPFFKHRTQRNYLLQRTQCIYLVHKTQEYNAVTCCTYVTSDGAAFRCNNEALSKEVNVALIGIVRISASDVVVQSLFLVTKGTQLGFVFWTSKTSGVFYTNKYKMKLTSEQLIHYHK